MFSFFFFPLGAADQRCFPPKEGEGRLVFTEAGVYGVGELGGGGMGSEGQGGGGVEQCFGSRR